MKMCYRGVEYDYETPSIEFDQGVVGGKYRGQDWKHRYPKHMVHLKPKIYMQYRGVAYSTCPTPLTRLPVNHQNQSNTINNYCSIPAKTGVQTKESTKIHLENMRRSLEHRLAIAQAKGDTHLINLLKKESRELSLL
jgi:hypothetical protein